MSAKRTALKLTAVYITFGLAWILLSDQALLLLLDDPAWLARAQTLKGWAFVLLTGILFGLMAYLSLIRQQRLHEYDTLTGLLSQYKFREVAEQHLLAARQFQEQCALAIINIDGFRQINGQLGQRQADELLQALAERLRFELPSQASIGRIAADEFCVALRAVDALTQLAQTIERVQVRVQHAVDAVSRNPHHDVILTCSAGLASFPQDAEHSKGLFSAANLALAEAKEFGRGGLSTYHSEYGEQVRQRTQLARDLDLALSAANQPASTPGLYLVYQPQYSINSSGTPKLIGVEALLRWSHPEHGLVSPALFIDIAEQQGLIHRLTDFVCARAVADLEQYQCFDKIDYVSINVSALDINSAQAELDFARRFEADERAHAWLRAGKIQLEITETALMHSTRPQALLQRLRQRGLRLSIDDFGTGYSSLSVISRLPIDELKIDQSFIHSLNEGSSEALIVRAIIAMAHSLKLTVVAEGVETAEQLTILRELACDTVQGYYLAKPVTPDKLEELYAPRYSSP
ncbi:putative bifunctional diguanylate cyclase/phosphodiesterase [Aliidiomarina maris]|nr:bifunctional diguanylate cyclase/phosphodiesterase [Aliidiomarina maris]RAJ96962.1 diguanylate cyclase/phosphodiesterase [Aliidiomarina maris]